MYPSFQNEDWLLLIRLLLPSHVIMTMSRAQYATRRGRITLLVLSAFTAGILCLATKGYSDLTLATIGFASLIALVEARWQYGNNSQRLIATTVLALLLWSSIVLPGLENTHDFLVSSFSNPRIGTLILAYIFLFGPCGSVIGEGTAHWRNRVTNPSTTDLANAGKWIGRAERILIFTLVIQGQYEIIGFLLAAKSAFRFPQIVGPDRIEAEYILVGTMFSVACAILLGVFYRVIMP